MGAYADPGYGTRLFRVSFGWLSVGWMGFGMIVFLGDVYVFEEPVWFSLRGGSGSFGLGFSREVNLRV